MYCSVGIRDGTLKHNFISNIAELCDVASAHDVDGWDSYFACATYNKTERKQAYAENVKSLWVDIDCGPSKADEGKGYLHKVDAIVALKTFCRELGLSKPFIVDSGRGLHVYWALTEATSTERWHPLARALKAAALALGLLIDPACTADAARILRVPGTTNKKDKANPLSVNFIQSGALCSIDKFEEILKEYIVARVLPKLNITALATMDATTRALMGNFESNFGKIQRKSGFGTGCAQIQFALDEAPILSEPLWHAALSIATRCNDGQEAIHTLSRGHSEYTYENTVNKANGTAGPRTCMWYKLESGNGEVCKGCKHTITSPIQLGKVLIEESTNEELETREVPASENTENGSSEGGGEVDNEVPKAVPETTSDVPEFPFPYSRGKNGGIYKKDVGADGETDNVLIYENDLYVVQRVIDTLAGECAVIRLVLPMDGVREFTLPLQTIQSSEKFRDALSKAGVVITRKNGIQELMVYTSSFVRHLQAKMAADKARTQFGWADGSSRFVLGRREISVNGEHRAPPSDPTKSLAPHMEATGDYDTWRNAFNMYRHETGDGLSQAFALMCTFGAPLIKFTGTQGALVSLVNTSSGTGKTAVLSLVSSVWGQPEKLMLHVKDTALVKLHRIGVMNCLPVCFDEMTNYLPADLSDFVYAISQGRGRNRMKSDSNSERENETTWNTIALSSGNAPIMPKLASHKSTAEGEMMRLFEIIVNLTEVAGARLAVMAIEKHYGHAGAIFAKWLVSNHASLPALLEKARLKVDKLMKGIKTKERFWVNTICANYVGGVIAKQLGLHDYDMDAILVWVCAHAVKQRQLVKDNVANSSDLLGEFMNENFGSTLVIDETRLNMHTMSNVIKPVQGKIFARVEVHNGTMIVTRRALKTYCVERQGDLDQLLAGQMADYKYIGPVKKRMTAGSGVTSPAVDAYAFEISSDMLKELRKIEPTDGK